MSSATQMRTTRNRMRCDGYDEEEERKANAAARKAFTAPQDERESRYWTKRLYEFEASDPNRWGHSGYKELYPEEFQSESDQKDSEEHTTNGAKTMHPKSLKSTSRKRKRSNKTSKKKRKKKSSKKVRWKKSLQSSDSSSGSESSAEEENSDQRTRIKAKKKHHQKAARKQKELPPSACESSSSHSHVSDTSSKDDSGSRSWLDKRKKRRKKKQQRNALKEEGDKEIRNSKKKHKNWKIAHNDTSEDSGDDDLN